MTDDPPVPTADRNGPRPPMAEEIDIGLIFPSSAGRPLDQRNVAKLAASIREVGLLHAICVRRVIRHRGTTAFDVYEIIGGHHRYAAVLELGWRAVRCDVVSLNDLQAEMAQIDENLIRANLSPALEASVVARRKTIYEALHPETKQHVAGAHASNRARGRAATDKMSAAFATATARATGKDERTVRRAAARGKALGDDLDFITGTSLDKGAELDALAKMPTAERREIVERAKAGEKVSAKSPGLVAHESMDQEVASRRRQEWERGRWMADMTRGWNRAPVDWRELFLAQAIQASPRKKIRRIGKARG